MKNIDEKMKQKIIAVISALIPQAKIILFGSRARGTNSERSDIDLALDAGSALPTGDVGELVDMFRESNIPYKIEIVDFYLVSKSMQDSIQQEGVTWKA